jgi:hypothetical protein
MRTIFFVFLLFSANVNAFFGSSMIDDAVRFFAKKTDSVVTTAIRKTPLWKNTHEQGRFGDYLTALRMGGMGYTKLKSKTSAIHGIDGVYIKTAKNNEIDEIIIIENKVDGSQLTSGLNRQMSKEWINDKIGKMLLSDDIDVRNTGLLLQQQITQQSGKVKKELWQHDIASGTTKKYSIDDAGYKDTLVYQWDDKMIDNTLQKWCELGHIECK